MVYQRRLIQLPAVKVVHPENKTCHRHTKWVLDWLETQSHLFPAKVKSPLGLVPVKGVMDPEKTFQSNRRGILGNQWMDGDGYVCNDDDDDDDDYDDGGEGEDDDYDYDDDHHHDFDYDREVNVCWLIGMPVSGFPARTIPGYLRSLQFCK